MSFGPNTIEDIISGARNGGWDWFDGMDSRLKQALEQQQARNSEEARTIASAWARFYLSPDGRKALELMFNTTLRRTVFFVQLGLAPDQVAQFGAFREGQNSLAHEVARQIALGLDSDEQLKPRDT